MFWGRINSNGPPKNMHDIHAVGQMSTSLGAGCCEEQVPPMQWKLMMCVCHLMKRAVETDDVRVPLDE
jgi:hypothetical protein